MINFFDVIQLDEAIIITVLAGIAFISILMSIITVIKLKRVKRGYDRFMLGKDTESLEDMIYTRFREIDDLKAAASLNKKNIARINEKLLSTFQKVGIVKYDAFNQMGGKLSFALCLLDEKDNGFVMNSMHGSDSCYTYVKEVVAGKSYIELGEEERNALNQALVGQGDVDLGRLKI